MKTRWDFELSVDIRSIKSNVVSYVKNHKTATRIQFNSAILCSRMDFIVFQFKNIFG